MPPYLLERFGPLQLTGDLPYDAGAFLGAYPCSKTALHSARVAREAVILATRFGADARAARQAGWLHDISAAIPDLERLTVAEAVGLEVLPEERTFPMIIHQKLSATIAEQLFGVTDAAVLSAIGCHTTLKQDATTLDKVVFVADKIRWDGEGKPPYLKELLMALDRSLDEATFCYLNFLWRQREHLKVVHPWLKAAHTQLASQLG